jgi:hypothetical protein
LRKPRITYKDSNSIHFAVSSIDSIAKMDGMIDHAAEVLRAPTSALRLEQKNGVVTISKVFAETSA